jgi:radical SAM superfamily enzyme YgiQ (UPF0313 family)
VESISQKALDSLDKPWVKAREHEKNFRILSKAGITISTEMIIGTDFDTEESIRETFRFVHRNKIPIPRFYILTPIPGTDLFRNLKEQGRLLTEDLKEFDGAKCVHIPDKITPEKLTAMYWWLNTKTFSLMSILHRVLLNKNLWKAPKMLLFSIGINFHYRHYVMKKVTPNIF